MQLSVSKAYLGRPLQAQQGTRDEESVDQGSTHISPSNSLPFFFGSPFSSVEEERREKNEVRLGSSRREKG